MFTYKDRPSIHGRATCIITAGIVVLILISGCGQKDSTATLVPPTDIPALSNTSVPPTATTEPTATPASEGASATPEAARPLGGSDGGVIAFTSERDGNAEIYIMNADGGDQRRLTYNDADDRDPSWSPDGTHITFASDRDGNYEIYVLPVPDGTELDGTAQRLTNSPGDDIEPVWSPDGTRIAFVSRRDGHREIYIMDADGSDQRKLTDNNGENWCPSWSPDGTQIAFCSDREGNDEIYVMSLFDETGDDGGKQRRLTNDDAGSLYPSWSPDGTQIAFLSHREGGGGIYIVDADGAEQGLHNLRQLPGDRPWEHWLDWSPDGTQIAFIGTAIDNDFNVYVIPVSDETEADGVEPDSRDVRRLTNDGVSYDVRWRPDATGTATLPPTIVPTDDARADGLSEEEAATLSNLEQVDDYPLYTMRYYGAYDHRLSSIEIEIERVQGLVSAELPNPILTVSPPVWACSLFAALGDTDNMLYGRNFDWEYSPAVLLFTDPPEGYASVSMVDIAYLGFGGADASALTDLPLVERRALLDAPGLPFDGMNEQGLAVGMAAVPPGQMQADPNKETIGSLMAIRKMLDHASNVDEAVTILQSYNITFGGPPLHYLVADPSGRSVLVEFYQGEMVVFPNEMAWHLATNFLRAAAGESTQGWCARYDRLNQRLAEVEGRPSMLDAMDLLAQVSQGNTQWSIAYGMNSGDINVVMGRQYDEPHTFHLSLTDK